MAKRKQKATKKDIGGNKLKAYIVRKPNDPQYPATVWGPNIQSVRRSYPSSRGFKVSVKK